MSGGNHALAQLGLDTAYKLGEAGYKFAGLVHQLSTTVIAQESELDRLRRAPAEDACRHCGEPLIQSPYGRPRLFCSPAHRQAFRRHGMARNGVMDP